MQYKIEQDTTDPRGIPAAKARQGRWGVQILIVLIVSLALAMAVWVGLEFYGQSIDTQSTTAPGATDVTPAPAP